MSGAGERITFGYREAKDVEAVNPIPVFIDEKMLSGGDKISQAMYKKDNAESAYENFLYIA